MKDLQTLNTERLDMIYHMAGYGQRIVILVRVSASFSPLKKNLWAKSKTPENLLMPTPIDIFLDPATYVSGEPILTTGVAIR
jgi:hypothetical protein